MMPFVQRKSKLTCENLQFATVCPQFVHVTWLFISSFSHLFAAPHFFTSRFPVYLVISRFHLFVRFINVSPHPFLSHSLKVTRHPLKRSGHSHDINLKKLLTSKGQATSKTAEHVSNCRYVSRGVHGNVLTSNSLSVGSPGLFTPV